MVIPYNVRLSSDLTGELLIYCSLSLWEVLDVLIGNKYMEIYKSFMKMSSEYMVMGER